MFSQTISKAARTFVMIGGALLVIVVLITVINVAGFALNAVARPFGYNVPGLPGYEDAVSLFIGVAALCMLPYCQLTHSHVSVDLFCNSLSETSLTRFEQLTDLLMGIAAAFFAVMLFLGMLSYRADGVRSPVLDWPVWPFMTPGIVAIVLWSLIAFCLAINPFMFGSKTPSSEQS